MARKLPSKPLALELTAAAGARYVSFVRRHLRAAHAILRPPLAQLSVALVGDGKMSELHERFMGIAGPTDVLTFPLDVDRRGRPVSGEIVICVPEARRRARSEGVAVERELLLYALHGMLHLCGYDDRTDAAFRAMHRTEDQILTRLGIGPVFAPPRRAASKRPARRPPENRAARARSRRRRAAATRGAH